MFSVAGLCLEHPLHLLTEQAVFRLLQAGILFQQGLGGLPGLFQLGQIGGKVRHLQLGQAVLPPAEKVSRAP